MPEITNAPLRIGPLTATTGTFSGAVSMTALTATTGSFSGAVTLSSTLTVTGQGTLGGLRVNTSRGRFEANATPGAGAGLEIGYDAVVPRGIIVPYDRDTGTAKRLDIVAESVLLYYGGITEGARLASGGQVLIGTTVTGTANCSASTLMISNTTAPSGNPTGGGFLFCESGALKYRGSSGTVTTLGVA